jgi:protein-tyrosine phosphatase
MADHSVLFICLGNLCRSPLAEGIFRGLLEAKGLSDRFEIGSRGTNPWTEGVPPHVGSQEVAKKHGLDISGNPCQVLTKADTAHFDWLIAMDSSNARNILRLDPTCRPKLIQLMQFGGPLAPADVPDPYHSGTFDLVFGLISEGCEGLLAHILDLK